MSIAYYIQILGGAFESSDLAGYFGQYRGLAIITKILMPRPPCWPLITSTISAPQVIYVDADQVVRADLRELWDMDLHGKPYVIDVVDNVYWTAQYNLYIMLVVLYSMLSSSYERAIQLYHILDYRKRAVLSSH